MKTMDSFGIKTTEAMEKLKKEGTDLVQLSRYGNLSFDIFKPKNTDNQKPHDRDEIYMIISGKGTLNCNDKRVNYNQGDIVVVPAGTVHKWESYSGDFCAWALMTTPNTGETMSMH
jgi:mannose-6-phosphate isomerase-like protein (cupin superfamily)